MPSKKALPKRTIAKFEKQHSCWHINEARTIATAEFSVDSYITGLMFLSRIVVMAEIGKYAPICTLSNTSVKIKIAPGGKYFLSESDIAHAAHITELFLSTKIRRRSL